LYFTQLIGLAFGIDPKDLGIGTEFIDARPALEKIGIEVEEEPPARKPRNKDTGLPMPQMPGQNGGGD
jgi:heterodisulfide reductase subunit B